MHQMSATQFRHSSWHLESDSLTVAFFISIFSNQIFLIRTAEKLPNSTPI